MSSVEIRGVRLYILMADTDPSKLSTLRYKHIYAVKDPRATIYKSRNISQGRNHSLPCSSTVRATRVQALRRSVRIYYRVQPPTSLNIYRYIRAAGVSDLQEAHR